jgi:hypothetical protein
VHEVIFEDGLPKVARVDTVCYENKVAVFFPIKGFRFFLEIHLDKDGAIAGTWIESGHRVYLRVTSDTLSYDELAALVPFNPTPQKERPIVRKFSNIIYEPIENQAYSLEQKLNLLLTELEKETEKVQALAEKADACIAVCRHQYINGNLGIHFKVRLMRRLAALNLAIDIDTYIEGNSLQEEL